MPETLGYKTKGASSWEIGKFFACRHVCPKNGILNSISVYLFNDSGSTQKIQLGIYSDVSGTLGKRLTSTISVSIPAAFNAWRTIISTAFLNLGSAYWLTLQLENSAAIVYVYYDAGDEDQQAYKEDWDFGTWPDNPAGLSYYANKLSIYATYTIVVPGPYVWGLMSKNQIDPEKIEAAISRIVAEHNNDEQAHIGEGRSLDQHKLSDVIDHVIASIVADKIRDFEIVARKIKSFADASVDVGEINDFAAFSQYVTGTGSTERYLRRNKILTGATVGSKASVYRPMYLYPGFSYDFLLDFRTYRWENLVKSEVYLKYDEQSYEPNNGVSGYRSFGFKIVTEDEEGFEWKIYAFVRGNLGITEQLIETLVEVDEEQFIWSIEKSGNDFKFYINGVLKATITRADTTPLGAPYITHAIKSNAEGQGESLVINFSYAIRYYIPDS